MEFNNVIIGICGVLGFLIAAKIYRSKKKKIPLACPLRGNCHAVITSNYSKFLGVSLEIWGMLYYACVVVGYIFFSFVLAVYNYYTAIVLFALTTFAFIFSLYLLQVQMRKLRQWCTWCVISASLCAIIFFFTIDKFTL